MQRELGAPGDFALAYVIAHEVGHHVQKLLGISEEVTARQNNMDDRGSRELNVRMELQADFLAGVWAHDARKSQGFIDSADIEEGISARATRTRPQGSDSPGPGAQGPPIARSC